MNEVKAWDILDRAGFKVKCGVFYLANETPTVRQQQAIDYLCEKWDYSVHTDPDRDINIAVRADGSYKLTYHDELTKLDIKKYIKMIIKDIDQL